MIRGLLIAAALAGCTVAEDPAAGGFYSGLQGIGSGSYADRLSEREADAADLAEDRTLRLAERRVLEAEIVANRETIRGLETDLDQARDRIRKRLAAIEALDSELAEARRAEAEAFLATTAQEHEGQGPSAAPPSEAGQGLDETAEESRRRIDALRSSLASAYDLSRQLAALSQAASQ